MEFQMTVQVVPLMALSTNRQLLATLGIGWAVMECC